MSNKREIVWSVSAKMTYNSLQESTRKSLDRWVEILSENFFSDQLTGRLHKVRRAQQPNMYYFRLSAVYRVFLDVYPERIELWAIVDHPAMTQLVKSMERA